MSATKRSFFSNWVFDLLLVLVLLVAASLRFTGLNWDEDQHLHPDERFLTGVVAALEPVHSLGEYFDTEQSTLNPNNRGAGFFVYGTLPVFMVRYAAQAVGSTGYDQVQLVGRALSAFADLGVIVLVFLIAARLFDKRVGLLAAVFSTLAVAQIQQSHYWTVDNFANFFALLAIFFAIRIATEHSKTRVFSPWDFAGFGLALGLALASKINQPPILAVQILMLPAAAAIRIWALPEEQRERHITPALGWLALAGGLAFLMFRIFQPYAFAGVGPAGWLSNIASAWSSSAGLGMAERIKQLIISIFGLNPHWVDSMLSLAAQVNGDADWPPSMQWARRSFWFGMHNIAGWGLGWPLFAACIGGLLWGGWRVYKGDWRKPSVLVWTWGAFYLFYESTAFNPTMRYFLPVYPVLAIFGAWAIFALWDWGAARLEGSPRWQAWLQPAAAVLGAVALVGAAVWAYAFVHIYQQEVSRLAATRWVYQNLPGPVTLTYALPDGGQEQQPLSVGYNTVISPETPFSTTFSTRVDGYLTQLTFKYVLAPVQLEIRSGSEGENLLAKLNQVADLEALRPGNAVSATFDLPSDMVADPQTPYRFVLQLPAGEGQIQIDSVEVLNSQDPSFPPLELISEPQRVALGASLSLSFTNTLGTAPDSLVVTFSNPGEVSLRSVQAHLLLREPPPILIDISNDQGELLTTLSRAVDWENLYRNEPLHLIFDLPDNLLAAGNCPCEIELRLPSGVGNVQINSIELEKSNSTQTTIWPAIAHPELVGMGETFTLSVDDNQGKAVDTIGLVMAGAGPVSLTPVQAHISLTSSENGNILDEQDIQLAVGTDKGAIGTEQIVPLTTPVLVEAGHPINVQIVVNSGAMTLIGTAVANETSWDDGLPRRMDGYDAFGGIYQGDLNFEMYWDADANKVARFQYIIDNSEYIFISSSRQWGSLPRIPERFPIVVAYYRALIGCPEGATLEACFIDAQVDNTHSEYGFELVKVFENPPQIGSWSINDQASEEAFTVYDHPKVFIFHKTADYDSQKWADLLASIDLSQVQHLTPKQASGGILPDLMLPPARLEQQQAGGTWSELFDTSSWINRAPWVSAIVWYMVLALLGYAVYPLVRWTLPGLRDKGFPFSRLVALLLLAYLSWMGGSLGLTFTRGWIAAFALLIVAAGLYAGWRQRAELRQEWQERNQHFLRLEFLFLLFFLLMLGIRFANPDLWHPSFGGEKPMDFSYFNAILKSTSFPPYDPWFAGGYINYYYYGFVLVGSLVKLLGIVPSVAYNLILPSLFAMLALGAYSLAWNLWSAWKGGAQDSRISPETAGLAAAVAVVLLGNLGSLGMLFTAFAKLGSEGAFSSEAGLWTQLRWSFHGLFLAFGGESFPIGRGSWYWDPTRIIPAAEGETGPISEFPLFTFTYADLHAHMIALPVTLLGLAWAASAVLSKAWNGLKDKWQVLSALVLGAIVYGSLRPINTWDLPTYLLIGVLATGYATWRYAPREKGKLPWVWILGTMAFLAGLSILAYQPFSAWYRTGYSSLELWTGSHTPSLPYFNHWGIFLFFIVAWLAWETRQWMAQTPLSHLRKLEEYSLVLVLGAAIVLFVMMILFLLDVYIVWFALPVLVWVGVLFLRPNLNEVKRLVLFLIGTGLFLTLMVEVIRLQGDISRMNTVFKFYLQAWILLGIGAAMAMAWTVEALPQWKLSWAGAWQVAAVFLAFCGAMFLVQGVTAKMSDRMAGETPHTLDGMAYMKYAVYYDKDQGMQLDQDYEAIRWMQENVQGSPVIVEAHTGEYKWGSRFAINTGLPAVLGWNWHQRQQREFVPGNDIWGRVGEIETFYTTTDLDLVRAFLNKYNVKYIIVGQLERAYYPGPGLDKFVQQDGTLWKEVFSIGDTVIYQVLEAGS